MVGKPFKKTGDGVEGGRGASKLAVFEIMENVHIMGVILQIINGKSQVKSVTKVFSSGPQSGHNKIKWGVLKRNCIEPFCL